MRFFKFMDEKEVATIKKVEYGEARTAATMRMILTVIILGAYGVLWYITGNYANSLFVFSILIPFYWIWYQWLPRFERRWEREEKQRELKFSEYLSKYVDANGIEGILQNLSERVAELEKKSK